MLRPGRRTATALACLALLATATAGSATEPGGPRAERVERVARVERVVARLLPEPVPHRLPLGPGHADLAPATSLLTAKRYSYDIPRSTGDRPDIEDGRLVHVVYFLPADKPDERLDTNGVIDLSIAAQNAWIARQTGGRRWRFDTFRFDGPNGRITAYDVTLVRSVRPSTEVPDINGISDEIIASGIVRDDKRYLVYAATDGAGACGEAYYPLGAPTNSAVDGQFAVIYLDAESGCQARDFATSVGSPGMTETIGQQEILHNDGLVPPLAPHQCAPGVLHVCTPGLAELGLDPERFDVLFPYVGVPLRDKLLDIGNDDYYRAPLALRDVERSPFLTD